METFKVQVPIEVRFRDLDSLGHVNNAVYFTYYNRNEKIAVPDAVRQRILAFEGAENVTLEGEARHGRSVG